MQHVRRRRYASTWTWRSNLRNVPNTVNDYILMRDIDRPCLRAARVLDTMFPTDHRLVRCDINARCRHQGQASRNQDHSAVALNRETSPELAEAAAKFYTAVAAIPPPPRPDVPRQAASWMSEDTWRLIQQRQALRRQGGKRTTAHIKALKKQIRKHVRQ
jgi:hypothetical protein